MSHPFLNKIGAATGATQSVARLADVLGSDTAIVRHAPTAVGAFLKDIRATAPRDVKDGATTVAGAAAGTLLWSSHRLLGLLGGASLGRNVPALFHREDRKTAAGNLASTGVAVAGSLLWRAHPALGFIFGLVAGRLVANQVGLK